MPPPLRIAISGGGLAGATLLHALLTHAHLDVHIFESAPTFREAGQAIGITRNALNSLDAIGPSATACLDRAGAVLQRSACATMAEGPDQGSLAFELSGDEGEGEGRLTKIVHRAVFLEELLRGVPAERMHVGKKLERAELEMDGSVVMSLCVLLPCAAPILLMTSVE